MESRRRKIAGALLLAGMAVCLMIMGQAYCESRKHRAQQEALKEMVTEALVKYPVQTDSAPQQINVSVLPEQSADPDREQATEPDGEQPEEPEAGQTVDTEAEQPKEKPDMLEKYTGLYEENQDLVGWLSIEGMKIDYPVMQNEDDKYYLHHDFYGNESKYGCLYVRKQADLASGTNFIIYGHNMKDGSMFGELDLYLKEDFYQAHPTVSFDTLYEERTYEIVAVFRSQIYNADEDVFKYYQFYEADTQEEFEDFYSNIKELSLYDTGVEAAFGDTFLTLSTCAYHVKDGRLVVVAKWRE